MQALAWPTAFGIAPLNLFLGEFFSADAESGNPIDHPFPRKTVRTD
jgi:hypothetical protein